MLNINRKDVQVLTYLRKNSRQTLKKISHKTSMPISTIFDKLKKLENSVITNHTSLLDFSKLGYNSRANVLVKVKPESKHDLCAFLTNNPNINNLCKINNGFDFLFETIFVDMNKLDEFLEFLDNKFPVENRQVYYVIKELNRESFLKDAELL